MKNILVHLSGKPSDVAVLSNALTIARLFNAHLDCIHVVPDRRALLLRAANVDLSSAMILTDALHTLEAEADKRLEHARELFFAFCVDHHLALRDEPNGAEVVSACWLEQVGKPAAALIRMGHSHDLIVMLGSGGHDHLFSADDIGDVIIGSGRPVLLVAPDAHVSLQSVTVAWKECPQAARALNAALPLLIKAERVTVVGASEHGASADDIAQCLSSATNHLAWHGVQADGFPVVPGHRTVADAVLETAAKSKSRLLVMGGFGHSRLREFAFGGFTQRVLDGTHIPAFVCH